MLGKGLPDVGKPVGHDVDVDKLDQIMQSSQP